MEAAFLILAIGLVLMALAPVAPSNAARTSLRERISRQMHLWDRYLLNPPGGEPWRE